jgi:hypothetical protein
MLKMLKNPARNCIFLPLWPMLKFLKSDTSQFIRLGSAGSTAHDERPRRARSEGMPMQPMLAIFSPTLVPPPAPGLQ